MADSDKNIIITPNIGQSASPNIRFLAANSTLTAQTITVTATTANDGTLMFSGNSGDLFSISSAVSNTSNTLTIVGSTTITGNLYVTGLSNTITSAGTVSTGALFLNSNTISSNSTIPTGYNGFAVGPITIANNVSVTMANNSRWVII